MIDRRYVDTGLFWVEWEAGAAREALLDWWFAAKCFAAGTVVFGGMTAVLCGLLGYPHWGG